MSVRVGVVAPSRRLPEALAQQARALGQEEGIELVVHPQCHLDRGHFAGTDDQRLDALLEMANDSSLSAVWFARGGYGSGRLLAALPEDLGEAARSKVWLGYSDTGFLLSTLWARGCRFCAHGPLVGDLSRPDGEAAARRALRFLKGEGEGVAPQVWSHGCNLALNLSIARALVGTPWQPDWTGLTLWLEDVGEHVYALDRAMVQLASSSGFERLAGVRLGRFSDVPENDVDFGQSPRAALSHWVRHAGVALLDDGDIGHDTANRIVPFGRVEDWLAAGLVTRPATAANG